MPHIQQLESHVADLIAAGEVVERPASVVKELVENAVDAGSSAVVVEIRRGGMGMIRVTDNGCGIAPEELPTAFLRHATSKLRTEEDLGKIGTLGFRGEALAAISAVSRVDLQNRIWNRLQKRNQRRNPWSVQMPQGSVSDGASRQLYPDRICPDTPHIRLCGRLAEKKIIA